MYLFWIFIAISFVIIETVDGGFGLIFVAVGALVNAVLMDLDIVGDGDIKVQMLIMSIAILSSCFMVFKTLSGKKANKNSFVENMEAVVVDAPLIKGKEGKVKWSGTVVAALLDEGAVEDEIAVGVSMIIKEFKGNRAIVKTK